MKRALCIMSCIFIAFASGLEAKTWFYNNTDFNAKIGIMPGISLELENVKKLETHLIEPRGVKTFDDLKGWHVIALHSKSEEGAMLVYGVEFPDTQNVQVSIYKKDLWIKAGLDEVETQLFT